MKREPYIRPINETYEFVLYLSLCIERERVAYEKKPIYL